MKHWFSRIPTPVVRERAHRYIFVLLLVFAATIGGTRLFLELTGYPQIGGGGLHIAHVLWGGLLLFAACLVLLTVANKWALVMGSVLGGVGMGLFMDEVGKFITESNDYFFPAAAPIIYAFFLLTILFYLQVRKRRHRDTRTELYQVLDQISELLESDLQRDELLDARERLRSLLETEEDPALLQLAEALLVYLNSPAVRIAPTRAGSPDRWFTALERLRARWLTQPRLRLILVIGLIGMTAASALNMIRFSMGAISPERLEIFLLHLVENKPVGSFTSMNMFLVQTGLQTASSLLMFASAVLLALRRDRTAVPLAFYGLLTLLTVGNILIFYFEQFSSMILASLQFLLLLSVIEYRQRFLPGYRSERSGHVRTS